jgi:LacI family transcriptional regulator
MPPATIRSLATATGLSKTTVSLALRDSDLVAPSTRRKVLQAAEGAGYRLNPMVSALMALQRRGKGAAAAPTIALVELFPNATHGTLAHLNRGYQATRRAVAETGYQLDRFSIHTPRSMSPNRLQNIIRNRGIRGVILLHGGDLPPEWQVDWSEFCVVELASPRPVYHSVKTDFIAASRLMIGEFLLRGYRRIGYYIPAVNEVYAAFRLRMPFDEHNRNIAAADRVPPLADENYTPESFFSWLDRHQPDVIAASGMTEMNWLREAGRWNPEKLGYAAFNLLPDAVGAIAGLDTFYDLRMAEAVHLLDGLLRRNQTGRPDIPMILTVPCRWVDGPTVRPRLA